MVPASPPSLPPPFGIRRATFRLVNAILVGLVGGVVVGRWSGWAVSVVAGWDLGTLVMLVQSGWVIARSTPGATRSRAAAEDPGRTAVFTLVAVASAVALFASSILLRTARGIAPDESRALMALCLASVILAWVLTHTAFTLRYARLYYGPTDGPGGLEFPGGEPPDDLDFAYFAFTIGMTFQVSDVTVLSRSIRRTVLVHGLLAFAYNTAIVALALNVFFTLLG